MATRYRRRMLRENNYRSSYTMSAHMLNDSMPYLVVSDSISKANQLHPLIRFASKMDGNTIDDLLDIEFSLKNKNVMLGIYNNFFNHIYLLIDLLTKPDITENIDQVITFANFIVDYINKIVSQLPKENTEDIGIDILDKARDIIITIIDDMTRTTNFTITNFRINYLNDVITETRQIIQNGIAEEDV